MNVWKELESLPTEYKEQLFLIYINKNFSAEIRGLFADWFEEQNWDFDEKDPDNSLKCNELLMMLLKQLEAHLSQTRDLINQMRLQSEKKRFCECYGNNAQLFVATVKAMLNEEKQLIASMKMSSVTIQPQDDQPMMETIKSPLLLDINQGIDELKKEIMNLEVFIKDYKDRHEKFILDHGKYVKKKEEFTQAQMKGGNDPQIQMQLKHSQKNIMEMEKQLQELVGQLKHERKTQILTSFSRILKYIQTFEQRAIEELSSWRVLQQRSLSDGSELGPLDEIQKWFEELTEMICLFDTLLSQYNLMLDILPDQDINNNKEMVAKIQESMINSFFNLIRRSFIVEKQPPQTLKTQTKFQASVRLLVGSKFLQMQSTQVSVSILSEKQCKEFVRQEKTLQDIGNCGEIFNDKCVMEQNKDRTNLHAEFKNLQLKKIKRQDRKGQESVLEAKSALVFSAKFKINGGTCNEISVHTMSVPVVVVVHGNQGPNSEATIFWDNMFSVPGREPFEVPDEVAWKDMSVALNARWVMNADEELHPNHLKYLKDKIFSNTDREVPDEVKVPWALFNKEPIKGRSFTFWEWFYGALEVVRKTLKEHWKDNSLEFMSRAEAQNKLLQRPPGTFLIRFSDGEIGSITIACTGQGANGEKSIFYIEPWGAKDFLIRSLTDRIFDIPHLSHLYPDIPKDKIFERFARETNNVNSMVSSGYVRSGIFTRIFQEPSSNAVDPSIPMNNFSPCLFASDSNPTSPAMSSYSIQSPGSLNEDQLMDLMNSSGNTAADFFQQNYPSNMPESSCDVETLLSNCGVNLPIAQQYHQQHNVMSNYSPANNFALQ